MNHPVQERRRFLAAGLSWFGVAAAVGSLGLVAGCSDDKGDMKMVEDAPDPTKLAKDSMDMYKSSHLTKQAKKK